MPVLDFFWKACSIDGILKSHCIDAPPRIASMGRNDFHHAAAAKSLQRLSGRIGFTTLSREKGLPDIEADPLRKGANVLSRRADPSHRLYLAIVLHPIPI